jgi:hypothetical protein
MKKITLTLISLVSSIAFSFAQVAVPTLYTGDVDPNASTQTQCVTLTSTGLRLGARDKNTNDEVSLLQDFLSPQYLTSEPTGYFGKGTLAAVKAFQKDNGILVNGLPTGYVGGATRAKIQDISCNGATPGTPSTPSTTSTNVGTTKVSVTPPVMCLQDMKICPDGTGVGRTGPNCEFVCPTEPPVPTVRALSASVIGTPTLALTYSAVGKEALLSGRAYVSVIAGNEDIYVSNTALAFKNETTGLTASANSITFNVGVASGATSVTGQYGATLYKVSAGQKATFVITTSLNPKHLFAGTYSVSLQSVPYYKNPNDLNAGYGTIEVSANKSRAIAIIGEVSPYLSSITTDANGLVRISGARLNLSGNRWFVDDNQEIAQIKGDAVSASFNPVNFNLPVGKYMLKVVNAQTGDSNSLGFNVGSGAQTANTPTVEFVGFTPTLRVTYDSVGKEGMLTASAQVKITTGNTPITFYQNSVPGILQFNKNGTGPVYSNNMAFHAVDVSKSPSAEVVAGTVIPANTSVTYLITNNAPTKELLAGSYSMSLTGFGYIDSTNNYQTVQPASFINGAGSNVVTIIGETSPYISNITTDANGFVRVTGARLDLPGNLYMVDGVTSITSSKGDAVNISFNPTDNTLSAGYHTFQILNPRTGNSNTRGFNVITGTQNSKPDVYFSVNPQVVNAGGSTYVSWSAKDAKNCIATSSPYLATWSSSNLGLSGSKTVSGINQTTMLYVVCFNEMSGLSTSQGVQVRVSSPTGSTSGAPTLARTAGFTAQTVSPNTVQVKIASFTIQAPSTNGVIVYNVTPNLYVSGYSLDNLSNVSLRSANSFGVESVLGVPIGRLSNNSPVFTFPDIVVDARKTRTFDVYADIGTASIGSVTTAMNVGYRTANIGLDGAVRADGVAVTSAVSTGFISSLNASSPKSQFVLGASSFGIANLKIATQGVGTTGTIRELQFSVTGQDAIESITVNGVTASVVQGVATISGLNIQTSNTGVDLVAVAKLSGFQNSLTGGSLTSPISPVFITLTKVTGISGSGSTVIGTTPVSSNAMSLVASKPTLTYSSGGSSGLVLGANNLLGELTVYADASGKIAVQSFSLLFATQGITNPSISNITVSDGGVATQDVMKTMISFPSGYEINAGIAKRFSVYGVVNGTSQPGVAASVSSTLNLPSLFIWKDSVTNSTQTGEKIYNYPTNVYRITGVTQAQAVSGVNKATNITFKNVTSTGMDIVATFNTTIPNTKIFAVYGTDRNLSASNCMAPSCTKTTTLNASSNGIDTDYTFSVTGLTPNTTVAYKAYAQDPNGNLVEGTWTTQAIVVPSGIVATCADADVNGDGAINTTDVSYVQSKSGTSSGVAGYDAKADMDKSGTINSGDILKIRALVSTCPQPAPKMSSQLIITEPNPILLAPTQTPTPTPTQHKQYQTKAR